MKQIFTTLMLILIAVLSNAQSTGSFNDPIIFNTTSQDVEYYVPTTYNSSNKYPLIVALHGCGGNANNYRDNFISIADSIGAILVCPDYNGSQMSGTAGQLIVNAIDSTINQLGYNIDTNLVYLTGYSCNGQETIKQTWNGIYPFRGIIPMNAWIPLVSNSDYNFDSKVPTCFCSGTADQSYNNNVMLFDSLIANGGRGKLVSMPGIPHTYIFATRDTEMMKCFKWFDSVVAPLSVYDLDNEKYQIKVFPNPANDHLNIKINKTASDSISTRIYDLYGKIVKGEYWIAKKQERIDISALATGMYILEIRNNSKVISKRKLTVK